MYLCKKGIALHNNKQKLYVDINVAYLGWSIEGVGIEDGLYHDQWLSQVLYQQSVAKAFF